jgi:hypothetical protein
MKGLRTRNLTFVSLVVLALPVGAALAADTGADGRTGAAGASSEGRGATLPKSELGGGPPPPMGQAEPTDASKAVRGTAEQPPPLTVGRAIPGPDGVSTKIVKPQPCSVAAHETDGTTTCIGIPATR